jgi:hypothetical protein
MSLEKVQTADDDIDGFQKSAVAVEYEFPELTRAPTS